MTSEVHHILLKSRPSDLNLSRYALTIEEELEEILMPDSLSPTANDTGNRIVLIEEILNVLTGDQTFDPSLAHSVLSVLSDQIETLSIEGVVNLTDYFVNIVKRGDVVQPYGFQVLTQLLKRVYDHELTVGDLDSMDIDNVHELTIHPNSQNDAIKQNAIQFQVINTLCASHWHPTIVLPLSNALKDVQMPDELYKTVADKCFNSLSRSEQPQDIPTVVKELLISITPTRVNSFLNALDLAYTIMETQIEGHSTVLDLHQSLGLVLLYLSQNRVVSPEVIKMIKTDEHRLSKLEASICIGLMGVKKYQQVVSDSLFANVLKSFKEEEKLRQSKLLRMFSEVGECERFGIILIDIAKFSKGWEQVVMEGFVKLGLNLIYNASVKMKENTLSTDPLAKTANLGVTLVSEIFKHHSSIREHILSSALEQIVNSGKKPYMTLLKTIITSAPQLVIDSTDRVADALDYITDIPLAIAYTFLDAIQPLMKYSLALRDTMLLKMRSCLLKKKKSARCIGVYGFLSVLKKFKINIDGILTLCSQRPSSQPFSSSQILVDIRGRPSENPEANEGLCREVLGILQRCFTQTSEVKQVLYNGLYDVLCVNPQLETPILEMLLDQLKSYIPRENRVGEAVQPAVFKLDMLFQFSGVDFVELESLPALVASIQLCYLKVVGRRNIAQQDTLDDDDILTHVRSCLEMLTQKMCDASLDDFDLNINSDFSGIAMGKKNLFIARTLIGVYEALIEYNFLFDEISPAMSERILLLFLKCERVLALLREKLLPQRRSMMTPKETEHTSFTFSSLVYILTSLLSDNNPAHEVSLTDLRSNVTLVRHVFSAVTLRLNELQANGAILDSPWLYQEKTFKKAYQLGRVLLRHIYTPIIGSKSGWKREKGRPLEQSVLESLAMLFSYVHKHMKQCKIKFLVSIRPDSAAQNIEEDNTEALSEIAYLHLQGFQSILMGIFTHQQDRFRLRDTPHILQICTILHSWMPIDSPQMLEVYEWWHRVCAEQEIADLNMNKDNVFLDNLFSLHSQLKISLSLFRKVAEDIHLILGDIDNETDIDDNLHYKIITSRNVTPSVSMLFLTYLERVLDETDWLITKLSKPSRTMMECDNNQDSPYETLSQRLLTLVATFHHLIQTSFPLGSTAESLPKLCAKLYNTFIKAVRYHIGRYNTGKGELSEKFLKVVTYTGTHLEQQMYSFISHFQSLESENTNSTKGKGKEKEKGKEKDLFLRPTSMNNRGKLMKQAKSYPNLIFALEQYETSLIILSKKCKRNLLESFKISTARDFRINSAAVDASLNELNELMGEDSDSNIEEDGNRSKRVRQDSENDESQQVDLSE